MMSFPPDHFAGKKVTVMGLGTFGGQIAVIKFLVAQGARVTVTDLRKPEQLKSSLSKIEGLDVTLHLGGHLETDFTDTELIVVSPAVPKKSRYLKFAEEHSVHLTSEMNLFLDRCNGKILAVTGTVGKSTTVSMIESILSIAQKRDFHKLGLRKYWFGGNIGKSLLNNLTQIQPEDLVLLELSSFQLEDLPGIEFSPNIAVVTNIYPNHLDRHGTMESYIEAKANITRYQQPGDILITRDGDRYMETIHDLAPEQVKKWRFGPAGSSKLDVRLTPRGSEQFDIEYKASEDSDWSTILSSDDILVPGEHNLNNALAASASCLAMNISPETIAEGLRRFTGISDRLELVADLEGIKWYNDSKSTTPQSGIVAIRSFSAQKVIAIAGGYDKNTDLSEFSGELANRAAITLCLGQTGKTIQKQIQSSGGEAKQVDSIEEAVTVAREIAKPGDVVLLSPGCASWDMFENYQERGKVFKESIVELTRAGVPVAS